jgi:RNA polymerase sigma-70 factor (ECF subfamily)
MNEQDIQQRLSQISTQWTLIARAHHPRPEGVTAAQQLLLQRYCGAIYRYQLGALRDPDAADEVAQEFAYCLVRGDFQRADPRRGRFRDFVKTVLFHLIINYQRQKQKQARLRPLDPNDTAVAAVGPEAPPSEEEFLARWREELLDCAWESLKAAEEQTGQPFYTVLRFKAENPRLSSEEMAGQVGALLGRSVTAVALRQTLHRARQKFADLLLEEVARSLETGAPDLIEQELLDLGLLSYCQPALKRRRQP